MSSPNLSARRTAAAAFAVALSLLFAACSDDCTSSNGSDATTTVVEDSPAPVPTVTEDTDPPATEPVRTDPVATEPEVTVPVVGPWEAVTAPSDCMCSDGSEFQFFVREGNPAKVVLFFEGGGACFSAETCGPESETYKRAINSPAGLTDGIFDTDEERNPFLGWSMVYVPYCTGDVHIGNATTDYGNGVVVEHKGYVNGNAALAELVQRFPDAMDLVVTGESAGSVPTPLYAGLAGDLLPAARITVLGDGSGAYPDSDGLNAGIGALWGTPNAIPAWPENEGLTAGDWSFPGLYVQAGAHNPNIVFARHDYAFDEVQAFFSGLVGIDAAQLDTLIDGNETLIEDSGLELWSYIAPGGGHTVLSGAGFYSETVNGTALVDWVTALVNGEPVEDVHCEVCTA